MLPEGLHPEGIGARLVTEAVPVDLDPPATLGQHARLGRVEGMADRRAQHHVGRLEQRSPVFTGLGPADELGVASLVAAEGVDGPHLVGEGLEVAVALERGPGHDRGEPDAERVLVDPDPEHQPVDGVDHPLVGLRPAVDAVHLRCEQQPGGEEPAAELRPGLLLVGPVPVCDDHRLHSPRWTRSICALFPMIRSLLTISDAPIASRRCRLRL